MTLSISYDSSLARRVLLVTGLNASTDFVRTFSALSPYVQWTEVRGWSTQPVASTSVTYYDYEFPPGVAYKYRVREYNAAGVELAVTEYSVSAANLTEVWLKVPAAPVLNTPIVVADRGEITNRSRSALMDVKGRTNPIQIGDVRAGLSYVLKLLTETAAAEQDMEYTLSTGDVIFLHLPVDERTIPGGYFSVGDVTRDSTLRRSPRRVWSLPLTKIVAPGPDVGGSAYTIASMLAEYATISDVLAGNATILDLLQRTGTPADVIVP